MWALMRKRQLLPLLGRLHRLGRELGDVRDKGHLGRDDELRRGIKHEPRLGPLLDPAGPVRGQEEGHVDVVEIDHVEHFTARGKHLAGLCDTVLHATGTRRLQCAVVDIRLDAFDCRLGGYDIRVRGDDCRFGRSDRGIRRRHVRFRGIDGRLGTEEVGTSCV